MKYFTVKPNARLLRIWALITVCLYAASAAYAACGEDAGKIDMTPDRWITTGEVKFDSAPGIEGGVMHAAQGSAIAKNVGFTDGTISFDIKPKNGTIVGIKFHEDGKRTADVLYLRPQPACSTSDDCLQYMPYAHGAYEWDLFPEYQTKAPLSSDVWNHVRLVVSGRRMLVFINETSVPALTVGRLEGDDATGTVSLHGPAAFANLVIEPDRVGGLIPTPLPDQTDQDQRYLRSWWAAPAKPLQSVSDAALGVPTGLTPAYADIPDRDARWDQVRAERKGLINLTRLYGSSRDGHAISLVWLKTSIASDRTQSKSVSLGWLREAWVYVNGKRVFAGRNLYGTKESKEPDGRLSLSNGRFSLPLHKGSNEVAVAIDDNFGGSQHFGWGFAMRLADTQGLTLAALSS